jgi:hypothetical protein
VKFRRNVERQIVTAVVEDSLQNGYLLQVTREGEGLTEITQNKDEIIETLMDLDEAVLFLYKEEDVKKAQYTSWILFVFGNDMGETVISDYTINLEKTEILNRANAISDAIENGTFTIALQ